MDSVYNYNRKRWEGLVDANALFTQPWLDLDVRSARERLDPWGVLGDLSNRDVLCLASGGGQQSAAFAVLGANVTVLDISDGQLQQDVVAAARYGVEVVTQQGDMRDLSAFESTSFDIVWQPYSLSFVPDPRVVYAQVARVIRPGGLYHFAVANPFASGMGTQDWNGEGYLIRRPYVEGAEITYQDEDWVFRASPEARDRIAGPREYRQTLGRILAGLAENHLVTYEMLEWAGHEQNLEAAPGTWDHFTSIVPPWLLFWTTYCPDAQIRPSLGGSATT
jgi:SAM-dependent methyltransferase